jgi:hypothetical protein
MCPCAKFNQIAIPKPWPEPTSDVIRRVIRVFDRVPIVPEAFTPIEAFTSWSGFQNCEILGLRPHTESIAVYLQFDAR